MCFGSSTQNEFIIQKLSRRSRDDESFSNGDGTSGRNKTGRPKSTASKRVGVQNKGNHGIVVDMEEQKVH